MFLKKRSLPLSQLQDFGKLWYSVFCILYSVFCNLYSVFCILYSVFLFCVLCSLFCILYSVFCILYSVFCILYSVFCILYSCSVFFILYSVVYVVSFMFKYRIQIQNTETHVYKTTYGPLIDTALYIMLLIRVNPLFGQVGEGWAIEISTILGPIWHSPNGLMPFHRAQKVLVTMAQPPPACPCNSFGCIIGNV